MRLVLPKPPSETVPKAAHFRSKDFHLNCDHVHPGHEWTRPNFNQSLHIYCLLIKIIFSRQGDSGNGLVWRKTKTAAANEGVLYKLVAVSATGMCTKNKRALESGMVAFEYREWIFDQTGVDVTKVS